MLILNWHLFDPLERGLNVTLPPDVSSVDSAPGDSANAWVDLVQLYAPLAKRVAHVRDPVVLSGDCLTALAVLAGVQRSGIDAALVWFDAHGDFHTEQTTSSGYLGGLPLAKAVGRGDLSLPEGLGLIPLAEDRVLLVDGRDLDPPEVVALGASQVRRATVDSVCAALPDGPLHVHVDLDVFDASLLTGLRFPAARGPGIEAVAGAVGTIAESGRLVALSIAATWRPDDAVREQNDTVLGAVLAAVHPFGHSTNG
jgi:arginase